MSHVWCICYDLDTRTDIWNERWSSVVRLKDVTCCPLDQTSPQWTRPPGNFHDCAFFPIFFFNTFSPFSSLHFSNLYASGKVCLCESAVVGRGQWWEEEGEEDDYLGIWINLYLGNGNVWKVIIWGLLVWISKISELELLGIQKSHLVHWGRRTDREEGEVGQHLAGVGWTDLEFHFHFLKLSLVWWLWNSFKDT